jgi:uncharacterized membrane protein
MTLLIVGLALFFGAHAVSIVADPWRNRMVARFGETGWQGLYSLVSVAGFVLMIWGFAEARQSAGVLYQSPLWTHHITFLLMLPVFPLLIAAYLPGRIQAWVRHPMLLAVIFWSAGHLLANGGVADVLLFGAFLVWAIADRISVGRRAPRPIHCRSRRARALRCLHFLGSCLVVRRVAVGRNRLTTRPTNTSGRPGRGGGRETEMGYECTSSVTTSGPSAPANGWTWSPTIPNWSWPPTVVSILPDGLPQDRYTG